MERLHLSGGLPLPSRRTGPQKFVGGRRKFNSGELSGLGAVAELERSLIIERVRAGVRNAKAKGKRLGRPPVDPAVSSARTAKVRELRSAGKSFVEIGAALGISAASACRAVQTGLS